MLREEKNITLLRELMNIGISMGRCLSCCFLIYIYIDIDCGLYFCRSCFAVCVCLSYLCQCDDASIKKLYQDKRKRLVDSFVNIID
jgi:hypothetical protein